MSIREISPSEIEESSGVAQDLIAQIIESVKRPTFDGGRNIRVGHLRGWGLEFGGLGAAVSEDPVYLRALQRCQELGSLLPEVKLQNLFLIIRYCLAGIEGDILEFGSYKGGSAVFMGALISELGHRSRVFALDSYGGMPATDAVRDLHHVGDFGDASLETLRAFLRAHDLEDRVIPVPGNFEDTFPQLAAETRGVALVHIDCDIHSAVKYAIQVAKTQLHGGYLIFDDVLHGSCLGAMQALEEDLSESCP